jgi:DNA-binding transcriptional LysR family regulator
MKFNSRQLEAFRNVMSFGSMTAAAREMGISQPAVSRLVSDLEVDVGFRLFERVNNKLIPTMDGRELFEHVERWYVGLDHIASISDRIRDSSLGHITMGAPTSLSSGLLNHIIARFLATRPQVTFRLEAGSSETTMRLISRLHADIGIVQLRASTDSISVRKLPDLEAICVMPPHHRLTEKQEIRVTDLEGEDIISLAPNSSLRQRTDAALLNRGVSVRRRIEASISTSIFEFINLGYGLAVTNPLSIHQLESQGLTWRPFVPALPYQIGLALPRHRSRSKLIEAFIAHIEDDLTYFSSHQRLRDE